MRASDLVIDRNISFLFKGPFGFGKTLAAASFALEGKIYIFYFDKKKPVELLWFNQFGEIGKQILNNIEYDIYGAHNANEFLNKVIQLNRECRYFAVVTDSITNLTASAVNWSLGFRTGGKKDKDAVDKSTPQMIPDFDEYKVETSMITQALDLFKTMPTNVIWTAHPLPQLKVEGGQGSRINVTKTNSIVTYGSKVAGIIPGSFTEIYHFSKETNWSPGTGSSDDKFIVNVSAIGDEYAKSGIFSKKVRNFDITDKLFYREWKKKLDEDKINLVEDKSIEQPKLTDNQSEPANPSIEWKMPTFS